MGTNSWSCFLGLYEFHSNTKSRIARLAAPPILSWRGRDGGAFQQVMEQHFQSTPESPCPSAAWTHHLHCLCIFQRKSISTEFLLPPPPLAQLVIWRQYLVTKTATTKKKEQGIFTRKIKLLWQLQLGSLMTIKIIFIFCVCICTSSLIPSQYSQPVLLVEKRDVLATMTRDCSIFRPWWKSAVYFPGS